MIRNTLYKKEIIQARFYLKHYSTVKLNTFVKGSDNEPSGNLKGSFWLQQLADAKKQYRQYMDLYLMPNLLQGPGTVRKKN